MFLFLSGQVFLFEWSYLAGDQENYNSENVSESFGSRHSVTVVQTFVGVKRYDGHTTEAGVNLNELHSAVSSEVDG